ncbi:MAG: tetratricopeptide repeat protein [Gemmataceae bacterium]
MRPRARLARWGIALFGGLAVTVLAVALFLHREGSQQRRAEALELARQGRMADAEPYLAEALARDPEDVEVLEAQAAGYLAAKQFAEAGQALSRWRALRPDDVEAHLLLIDLSLRQNHQAGAIDAAGEVLRLKPRYHELRQKRAIWLLVEGRTEEADRECRLCREGRPNDPALLLLQAEICYRLGDLRQTEQFAEAALRQRPNAFGALVLRGAAHVDAGRPEQAVAPLQAALAAGGDEEGEGRARHYLSLALARTGQEAEARRVQAEAKRRQAVRLWKKYGQQDTAAYKVILAESLLETGNAEEAVRVLEQVVAQSPDCPAAHRLLARHFQAQGREDRAAEHRRKAGD